MSEIINIDVDDSGVLGEFKPRKQKKSTAGHFNTF